MKVAAVLLSALEALAQAETLGFELQDMGVEREAIEQGRRESLIAEDLGAVRELQRGRQQWTRLFMLSGEEAEEQIRPRLGEGDEAHLIDHKHLEPQEGALESAETDSVIRKLYYPFCRR